MKEIEYSTRGFFPSHKFTINDKLTETLDRGLDIEHFIAAHFGMSYLPHISNPGLDQGQVVLGTHDWNWNEVLEITKKTDQSHIYKMQDIGYKRQGSRQIWTFSIFEGWVVLGSEFIDDWISRGVVSRSRTDVLKGPEKVKSFSKAMDILNKYEVVGSSIKGEYLLIEVRHSLLKLHRVELWQLHWEPYMDNIKIYATMVGG